MISIRTVKWDFSVKEGPEGTESKLGVIAHVVTAAQLCSVMQWISAVDVCSRGICSTVYQQIYELHLATHCIARRKM